MENDRISGEITQAGIITGPYIDTFKGTCMKTENIRSFEWQVAEIYKTRSKQ